MLKKWKRWKLGKDIEEEYRHTHSQTPHAKSGSIALAMAHECPDTPERADSAPPSTESQRLVTALHNGVNRSRGRGARLQLTSGPEEGASNCSSLTDVCLEERPLNGECSEVMTETNVWGTFGRNCNGERYFAVIFIYLSSFSLLKLTEKKLLPRYVYFIFMDEITTTWTTLTFESGKFCTLLWHSLELNTQRKQYYKLLMVAKRSITAMKVQKRVPLNPFRPKYWSSSAISPHQNFIEMSACVFFFSEENANRASRLFTHSEAQSTFVESLTKTSHAHKTEKNDLWGMWQIIHNSGPFPQNAPPHERSYLQTGDAQTHLSIKDHRTLVMNTAVLDVSREISVCVFINKRVYTLMRCVNSPTCF